MPADRELQLTVALSVLLFGALLIAFAQGMRFMPVEIGVERTSLSWNGERLPWSTLASTRIEGPWLEVLGDDGTIKARMFGARPEVARWLASEIDAAIAEMNADQEAVDRGRGPDRTRRGS